MKILIIGFGSIGKRHYRNLILLGCKDIAVFDPMDKAFSGVDGVVRIKKLDVDWERLFLKYSS